MHEQRTAEWHAARLGKVTSSRFKDVLTKAKSGADFGKPAATYMLDLMAERLTLEPTIVRPTEAMRWGIEHEDAGIAVYEAATGYTIERMGFYERPALPDVGCSPDGLVSATTYGGVELKCPFKSSIHLAYWLGGVCPKEHIAQVQGSMWVTQREWWDFCSYDPRMQDAKLALFRVRVKRDENYIENLAFKVKNFLDVMHADLDALNERLNN